MHKVYVVGGDTSVISMFKARAGWSITQDPEIADLIQFTGGADISPALYGEVPHPRTYLNPRRDEMEVAIFEKWRGKKMAGICRGGQLLNALSGGKMWQDINNHGIWGTHEALDLQSEKWYGVTSVHHQMMIPAEDATKLLVAYLTTRKETPTQVITGEECGEDIEALYYESTQSLCFQGHPEFSYKGAECQELYFEYLNRHLGLAA